jgi:hypothetical protein
MTNHVLQCASVQMQTKISLGTDAVLHKTDSINKWKIPLNLYAFQRYVNNKLYYKQIMFTRENIGFNKTLNAEQNSIEVALIPHVRTYKTYYVQLTCSAEIKRQDLGLPLAIVTQALP